MPDLLGFLHRDRPNTRRVVVRPPVMPPRYYERPRPAARPEARTPRRAQPIEVPWRRVGIIAAALILAGGATYGMTYLLTGDTLRVRTIAVEGVEVTDPQAVAHAAQVGGASMLLVDTTAAGRAVAKLPAVQAATVTRVWPRTIRIDVIERQGWGYWQAGSQRAVIDADGRVIEQSRPPVADAPTVSELGAPRDASGTLAPDPDTVRLIDRLKGDGVFTRLDVKPTGFVFQRDRGLTVMVANGPAAVFGDSSNYEFKVKTWEALLRRPETLTSTASAGAAEGTARRGVVAEIDLRFGRNVVLR